MRNLRLFLSYVLCPVLLMIMAHSCTKDDSYADRQPSDDGATLVISVDNYGKKEMTRASDRTDRRRIENINIVLVDGTDNIKKIIYLDNGIGSNLPGGQDGLISGTLPNINGQLSYHISKATFKGTERIFVVCNFLCDEGGTVIRGDLNQLANQGKLSTVAQLKALHEEPATTSTDVLTSTLFGEAQLKTGETDSHGGARYTCNLMRTTAMITVAMEKGSLTEGVSVTPRQISLHNVPRSCMIGMDNSIGKNEVNGTPTGLSQQVGWKPLAWDNDVMSVGGHGSDENITPLFMFENLQGTGTAIEGNKNKLPPSGQADDANCSYIEVLADYLYIPQKAGDNQKYISGPIKYRLYLGANTIDDFNVKRNTHYQVTLTLDGMAGLVEDGMTTEDGAWLADEGGASWRIETTGVTAGGSFLSDGLDMATNGFLSYVGFVGDTNHKYSIYEKSNSGESWVWTELGGWWGSPTKSFPAKVYTANEVGGTEGVSYIKLYSQPWLHNGVGGRTDYWLREVQATHGKNVTLKTMNNWIQYGYRSAYLVLYDNTDGKVVNEFELRQWLPMPVMVTENSDGTYTPLPEGADPNEASLYYSRIDVYEGKPLPWGPEGCETWAKPSGAGCTFYNGIPFAGGKKRNYNSGFGFDISVALFAAHKQIYLQEFESDNGTPQTATSVALFRAGNCVTNSGGSPEYEPNQFGRIGLPSEEEWKRIAQYGAVDPRFGLPNVPYWTSTMEGSQSYTYNPVTTQLSLKPRTEEYRVRLVYHKTDNATIP